LSEPVSALKDSMPTLKEPVPAPNDSTPASEESMPEVVREASA
jgi:hypothetical protein